MSRRAWSGQILLRPGAMVYAGPLAPTGSHRHHAWQLVLAPSGIDLAGPGGRQATFTAALVPAGTEHAVASPAPDGRLVLLDPSSSLYRRLPAALREPGATIRALDGLDPAALCAPPGRPLTPAWLEGLLARCGAAAPAPLALHPGVRRAQRALGERLGGGDVSLASLAAEAGLSSGRLAHVLREQVGLPLRPYVLWLRMQRAVQALARGRSLTAAAHEAGFADGSHLSRTFRRMFGLAPSDVAGRVRWIVPDEDDIR